VYARHEQHLPGVQPTPTVIPGWNWCISPSEDLDQAATMPTYIARQPMGELKRAASPTQLQRRRPAHPALSSTWFRRRSRCSKSVPGCQPAQALPAIADPPNFSFPGRLTTSMPASTGLDGGCHAERQASAPRQVSVSTARPLRGPSFTVLVAFPNSHTQESSLNLDQAYEACRQETAEWCEKPSYRSARPAELPPGQTAGRSGPSTSACRRPPTS